MSYRKICLHYTSNFLPLTMVWIYNLLEHFQNYDPFVLTRKKSNENFFPYGKIKSLSDLSLFERYLNIGISKITGVIPFFSKKASEIKPDILHVHLGNIAYKLLPLKKRLGIPGLLSFYGADAYLYPTQMKNQKKLLSVFRDMDKILVLGPAMQQELKRLGCPEKKIEILHLGIDTDKIAFAEKAFPLNRPLKFLLASSFVEKKGIDITLTALERIRHAIDFSIEIIGDGPLRLHIIEKVRKARLQDKVIFHGYKPYAFVLEKAHECDVFLQASRTASNNDKEGTPMVLVDVMAAGMPVISTKHSDIPEIVVDNYNGYLAEENDVESFTASLMKLINNADHFNNLSNHCRSHVIEQFNIFRQVEKLESLYNALQLNY